MPLLPAILQAGAGLLRRGAERVIQRAGTVLGSRVGGIAVGTVGGTVLANRMTGGARALGRGDPYYDGEAFYRRRRRRGLSGRDIEGAQRVARVVSTFGYKPKFKRRKGRR